jgi:hypothetical protein
VVVNFHLKGCGRRLDTAGPVAVDEYWDHLRHDSGYSAVLWISEWPRIEVPSSFQHALVFAPGIRKTISITATPLSTAQAMRDIRKAKVELDSALSQVERAATQSGCETRRLFGQQARAFTAAALPLARKVG